VKGCEGLHGGLCGAVGRRVGRLEVHGRCGTAISGRHTSAARRTEGWVATARATEPPSSAEAGAGAARSSCLELVRLRPAPHEPSGTLLASGLGGSTRGLLPYSPELWYKPLKMEVLLRPLSPRCAAAAAAPPASGGW